LAEHFCEVARNILTGHWLAAACCRRHTPEATIGVFDFLRQIIIIEGFINLAGKFKRILLTYEAQCGNNILRTDHPSVLFFYF